MPTKVLSVQDLDNYGKEQENGPTPAPGKVLSLADLDAFGKPGTKVEHGKVDPKSISFEDAMSQFGNGVVNNLPLIGATAATIGTGGVAAIPLAAAGGAAGYLGKEAIKPTHDSVGGLLKDTAIEGATDAAGEGIGQALNAPIKALMKRFKPASLVESAIMPQVSLPVDKRERVVQKMLTSPDISPDAAGYKKVLTKVGENNKEVKGILKTADGKVPNVDPTGPTFQRNLVDLKKTFRTQADPKADLKVIRSAQNRWEDRFGAKAAQPGQPTGLVGPNGQPLLGPGTPAVPATTLLPSQAQELKQGTYRMNRKKYGQLGTAQDEFEKTVARGLAEDIVDRVPSVGPINKDSSEFLELADQLKRFVGREGNKRLIGLKAMIAAHGVISEDFARAALEAGAVAIDNPHVKVALARVINKAGKTLPGRAVAATAPGVLPTASKAFFGGQSGILAPRSDVDNSSNP